MSERGLQPKYMGARRPPDPSLYIYIYILYYVVRSVLFVLLLLLVVIVVVIVVVVVVVVIIIIIILRPDGRPRDEGAAARLVRRPEPRGGLLL